MEISSDELDKELIEDLKEENPDKLSKLVEEGSGKDLKFLLKNMGRLPDEFDGEPFIKLLDSEEEDLRYHAVKNVGRLKDDKYLGEMKERFEKEDSTEVRSEIISTIGRMRSEKAKPFLVDLLEHKNPEIVLQAVRALYAFKKEPEIREKLESMINHENEVVRKVIRKDFFPDDESIERHTEYPEFMENKMVQSDVRKVLDDVPDNSIHLTFTSPPYYNARDYSIYKSYEEYLDFLEEVFEEVHRVTKKGRYMIVNTSPVLMPRVGRNYSSNRYPIPFDLHERLTDNGWEFIDEIIWLKPEASAVHRNAGFVQHRKPLAYKPNARTEYLMVYRKDTTKLLDWNINQYSDQDIEESKVEGEYESSNVWEIAPSNDKEHSAVFPEELCEKVIKFYSMKNDLVFDPFAGTGTLGKSALKNSRKFFMTEIEEDYIQRAKEKLNPAPLDSGSQPNFQNLEEFKTDAKANQE